MDKELEELMQINGKSENKDLSEMINDINPTEKLKFTDLELEVNNKQEFSMVIYKKEKLFDKIFRKVRLFLEKFQIMKHSREFSLIRVNRKELDNGKD